MKKVLFIGGLVSMILGSCNPNEEMNAEEKHDNFEWQVDRFADIKVLRYQIPSWDDLTPKQRIYAYHLNQAGLAGRDIMWDCNYRHNLEIRRALEAMISSDYVNKESADYQAFELYAKRVFFANGIHHHYSNMKFAAEFNQDWFTTTLGEIDIVLSEEALRAIFDPTFDAKKVNRADGADLLLESAVNFYAPDVTQAEAEAFYAAKEDADPLRPVSHGLNSRLSRDENGAIYEEVFSARGRYANSIKEIIGHLERAKANAENEEQATALGLLIEYYETGDLAKWDDYNIAWVGTTGGDVDYINGFVEVYNDPMGYRGSYETIVQVKDFDASARMAVVADNVQWFEDNSPIMDEHKKESVVGVSYKIVTVAGEAGDATPSTPIGVN